MVDTRGRIDGGGRLMPPNQGLYDLTVDPTGASGVGPIGIMLDRTDPKTGKSTAAVFSGGYAAAETDDPNAVQTIPVIQSDFSGGALYSKTQIPNGYAWTNPGYARSPRGVSPPGAITTMSLGGLGVTLTSPITDAFEIGGDLYFLAGRYAIKLAGGTGTPSLAQDLGVGFVADGAAVFNGAAYVGGSGGNIWKVTSGGVWSQSADVSHRKAAVVTWLIASAGLMEARLVMGDSALTGIRYTGGDPMALANWTPNPTSIPVGDSSYPITSICAAPNHFYVAKQDGLYDLNSRGETPNLLPEWRRDAISAYNGAASIYRDGYVYLGHTVGADRYNARSQQRQNVSSWIWPTYGVVNETPMTGPITAWVLDQGWLLGAVYNPSLNTSYLISGRPRGEPGVPNGPGAMLWHGSEIPETTGKITCLYAAVVSGQPRLWQAIANGSSITLRWQYLANAVNPAGEIENGSAYRSGTTVQLLTSAYDWNDPDARKTLRLIGLRADNLGSGVELATYANAEGGSYVLQDVARVSPRSRITPRDPLTAGHEIGVKLVGTGTSTRPPVIRTLKLDGELQNEQFDRRIYPIRVGRQQALRGGVQDPRGAATVWAQVAALHASSPSILPIRDQEGQTLNVRFHPVTQYRAVEDEAFSGTYTRSGMLSCTVYTVATSGSVIGARWGDGSVFGDGSYWGGAVS
jgi:hypothetical protein